MSVQRFQPDWSVERAEHATGLVGRERGACRRIGRSRVQHLQADWSVGRAALESGLVNRERLQRTGRSGVQRLNAVWSVERAVLADGLVRPLAALAAELVSEAFSACMRTG